MSFRLNLIWSNHLYDTIKCPENTRATHLKDLFSMIRDI